MRVFVVFVLAGLVLACNAQESWNDGILDRISSLFETSEKAPFVIVKIYDAGYEERQYPARKWVCTEHTAASDDEGSNSPSFMILSRYITGANDGGQNIPMTIPVSTQKTPSSRTGMYNYRMCFYIGKEHQQSPPTPTEEGVFIEDRPQITIFTRRLEGYPINRDWTEERRDLEALVAGDGNTVKQDDEYMSGFQSPMQFWSRRNELWLVKN